jgi:hypothetical protein
LNCEQLVLEYEQASQGVDGSYIDKVLSALVERADSIIHHRHNKLCGYQGEDHFL